MQQYGKTSNTTINAKYKTVKQDVQFTATCVTKKRNFYLPSCY